MMQLSIIIINWHSADYVKKCLSTLYANAVARSDEIIVVDNGSFDSCQNMIADLFPKVVFLQSTNNVGFAQANNLGSGKAQGEFLLFLNPDTEILGNAIGDMLTDITELPQAGVLGCRLLNTDMTFQSSCRQAYPTVMNQMLDLDILHRLLPGLSLGKARPFAKDMDVMEAQVISGACMMIRRSVFEEVGGFSSEYFMYAEDVDLCFKVRCAGYMNYYTSKALVVHHGGGSSYQRNENSFAHIQMRESIFRFLKKTRGESYACLYKRSMLLSGIMRLCAIVMAVFPAAITGKYSRCRVSFKKWKSIVRWTLGKETWVGQKIQ